MSLSKEVLYYGRDESLPVQRQLRAGPLTLVYEAGDLRYVRLGEHEILRRVYVAVRDRNWGTVPAILSNEKIEAGPDHFRITYDVENRQGEVDFRWQGAITGQADGTITFRMGGQARSTFLRNRLGFCVLHPMACAGVECRIEHVEGAVDRSPFPVYIAPQLVVDGKPRPVTPFEEMRAMAYEAGPGVQAEIRFEGDIFEMEDQRNWTDASYKTYCTPLRLPFPVEVKAGTKIAQAISLTLEGDIPADLPVEEDEAGVTFAIAAEAGPPLPRLGLGMASHGRPLTAAEISRLKSLNLAHLRLDLRLSQPGYEARLRQAATEAEALGVSLEVALFLTDAAEAELNGLVDLLTELKPPVWAWLIFHEAENTTSKKWVDLARTILTGYNPQAKIGGGTNVFFTDLNRDRPQVSGLDLVSYSLNPQVHAFDNLSLAETLPAQAVTVESARQFVGDVPLAVGPVTLKMRFNPNATGPEPEPAPGELPPQVDPRQMSLFGAGWTAGSLKFLAQSGVQSLTYYETSGWRGVMETEAGSPAPEKFRSLPGAVFPLYHVLADVGDFAGGQIVPTRSSHPLLVEGLALEKDGRRRVALANLSPDRQPVTVRNLPAQVTVRSMDAGNAETAMRSPETFRQEAGRLHSSSDGQLRLSLDPYAVVRVDG